MSGQPNKNPTDQTKFRQQYLASLNLRARLDDVNLQANKVYTRTGQLPVEPSDFRSTEEKLADVGRLRIEARSKLSEITDGREANKIAQELTPKELLFYSQKAEELNKILKPKYRLGIYADIFVPYLQNYMNNTANVNGIKDGQQQTSGADVDLNSKDIKVALPDANELRRLPKELAGELAFYHHNDYFEHLVMKIADYINAIETFYLMRKHLPVQNANNENEAYKIVNGVANNIITKVQLHRWKDKLKRVLMSRDMGSVNHMLDKGIELMYIPDENIDMLRTANTLYPALLPADEGAKTPGSATKRRKPLDLNVLETYSREELIAKAAEEGIELSTKNKQNKQTIISAIELALIHRGGQPTSSSAGAEYFEDVDTEDEEPKEGKGIYGRGLSKPKLRRQDHLSHNDTDWTNGIVATKRFVPFGRYVINRHRLDKDIVAIKRPAGSSIKNLPSEKVSRRLGQIIRDIVGGGIPAFDDLEKLNDQEKAYLNKIATETNIKDRLSIPAPKKSDIDKETNEYEIMRGEIMSGNDNKDLVKKFKIVLLKLMNKGVIPKGQAKEILVELTSMGF